MIPQWIVNQFAPAKGMEVKKFESKIEKMKATLKKREENGWKKDHEPLFDPHPKLMYVEKDQDDQKDDQ